MIIFLRRDTKQCMRLECKFFFLTNVSKQPVGHAIEKLPSLIPSNRG